MPNRAGLKKVTKTVRGKKGMVRRSYWVRGKSFARKHAGKIVAGVALGAGAALAYKHRDKLRSGVNLIHAAHLEGKRISRREKLRTSHPDRAAQGHDTSKSAVSKASRAGYMKGVMNSELGRRYQNWRGSPMKDAQGNTHGRVKRI